jgi:hypothetical protein
MTAMKQRSRVAREERFDGMWMLTTHKDGFEKGSADRGTALRVQGSGLLTGPPRET